MLIWLIVGGTAVLVLYEAGRLIFFGRRTVTVGKQTTPVSQTISPTAPTLLILGDSTAYGTGASEPKKSLVGQLANNFPSYNIVNEAENGYTVTQVRQKLYRTQTNTPSAVMIYIGGMDTIAFTPYKKFYAELAQLLSDTKKRSVKKVFLISANNTGSIPLFRFPLQQIYTNRSRRISKLCQQAATEAEAIHIPLYTEIQDEPLLEGNVWHVSADRIHPNDDGYRIWYQEIHRHVHPYL